MPFTSPPTVGGTSSHCLVGPSLVIAAFVAVVPLAYSQVPDTPSGVDGGVDSLPVFHLPDVVITATRLPTDLFRVPREVTVLQGGEGGRAVTRSTPDFLGRTSAVLIQRTGYGAGSPVVRGLIGNQVLILLDGVRLNNSTFRLGPNQYLNTVDPALIQRVEIVHGPASVLYGTDALGGVINIVTRKTDATTSAQIRSSTSYETADNGFAQRLELGHRLGTVGLLASGSIAQSNDVRGGEGIQKFTAYSRKDAYVRADWAPHAGQTLTAAYQWTKLHRVPRTDRLQSGQDLKYDFEPQERQLASVAYEIDTGSWLFHKLRGVVSLHRQVEGRDMVSAKTPSLETYDEDRVNTWRINGEAHSDFSEGHVLVSGVEFYRDNIRSQRSEVDHRTGRAATRQPQYPDGSHYEQLGLYVQDDVTAGDFRFLAGMRYSRFAFTGLLNDKFGWIRHRSSDLTGDFHVLFAATGNTALVAGIYQGFRAPSTEDLAVFGKSGSGSGARFDVPSPQLRPEKTLTVEAGVRGRLSGFSLSAFTYITAIHDLIVPQRTTYGGGDSLEGYPVYGRMNAGRAELHGMDFSVLMENGPVTVRAELTWTWGQNFTLGEPVSRIPPLRGVLSAGYAHEAFHAEGLWMYSDPQHRLSAADKKDGRIGVGGTPGYWTLDLRAGYRLSDAITLDARIENIFNEFYKTHGSGVYGPGRSFGTELTLSL